jgi:hypothetical protein
MRRTRIEHILSALPPLQAADATANLSELKKVGSWMQDSYIEKGGWATFPGMTSADRGVAQACATLLTALH